MTTNGSMLAPEAERLHACGLRRVNISLPTLNHEAYVKLTDGNLDNTLRGIKSAVKAGLCPVKLNMVVLNGINVDDVPQMMDFARQTGTILQLIELDPVNVEEEYFSAYHKVLDEYEEMLKQKATAIETRKFMHNRHVYRLPDVTVEIVHPTENREFCAHCTRLRVTSNGMLKTCLMRNDNLIDILTPLRNSAGDEDLKALFLQANQIREPYNKSR
jgi:cyclic pyranopterin phosphate synthase